MDRSASVMILDIRPDGSREVLVGVRGFFAMERFAVKIKKLVSVRLGQIKLG